MKLSKTIIIHILFILTFFILTALRPIVAGTQYDLIAPEGELKRGDEIQFTVTIDTGSGASPTTAQIGLTYDTKYLEYKGTTPGDTYSTISAQETSPGKIFIMGQNPIDTSSDGVLAYINFKIIAAAPGSTQLCTLFAPSTTPAATPTTPPGTPQPTTPAPTSLPKTGNTSETTKLAVIGGIFLAITALITLLNLKLHSHNDLHRKLH